MKNIAFILTLFLLLGCNNNPRKTVANQAKGSELKQQEDAHEKQGAANEFMHRSSVDDLIDRFESPERDAYQQPQKVLEYLGNIQGQTIMDNWSWFWLFLRETSGKRGEGYCS